MFKRLVFLLLVVFVLSGCATVYNPATQRKEIILIDDKAEIAIGRNVVKELEKEEKLSSDKKLEERVNNIGQKLALVSDRPLTYKFQVLENKELNAVSLPGGFIYINQGLLDKLSDDELAFVLGHEVGHVAAKHAVKKIQSGMAFQIILLAASAATSGGDTAQVAGNVIDASSRAYGLISLGYSRQDEYFADWLGVKYASKAGFNSRAAISALEKIKKDDSPNLKILVYLRTHPYVDDRIKKLKETIPQITNKQAVLTNRKGE